MVELAKARPKFLTLFKPVKIRYSGERDQDRSGPSFPSGHVTNNMTVALVLAFFFRRWGWLYFLVAAAIAWSRVYLGAHWPSDVLATFFLAAGETALAPRIPGNDLSQNRGALGAGFFAQAPASRGRRHFMNTTRAVWIFVLVLTALRLALLGATQLSPDEAYYWMWSQRPALSYFSKGPGVAFVIRVEHDAFWRQRVWSAFLEPAPRRRHEPASLLFCAAPFQRACRFLDGGRAERHADLQSRAASL